MRGRRFPVAWGVWLLLGISCASGQIPYEHSRYDYRAFQARLGPLPEPNYLPWVAHREQLPDGSQAFVICRWPDSAFPLRYYVDPPAIPDSLQNEFYPRDPIEYVRAVEEAFSQWQLAIGRPVRFERVEEPERASVIVRVAPSDHPDRNVQVLGKLEGEEERCAVLSSGQTADEIEIRYAADEIWLYVTDRDGLLTPRQVRRVAMHEIGHLLGASAQHSPLRGDLMYPVAQDNRVEALSEHDINSFRSLYRLPPGTVYTRIGITRSTPMSHARRAPPRLAHERVHDRFPVALRFPVDWQVIRTSRGWAAVDGLSWDYDALIQVMVLRGSVEKYLQEPRLHLLLRGELVSSERLEVDGRPTARIVGRTAGRVEEIALLGWGPGWVVVVMGDTTLENYDVYKPWFRFTVLSIDHPKTTEASPGVAETP